MRSIFIKRLSIVVALVAVGAAIGYAADDLNALPPRSAKIGQAAAVLPLAAQVPIDEHSLYPVTDVVDGDTFKIEIVGKEITVRMLGINTPEVVDPRKPVECYGPEASAETKHILTGKKVRLALNPHREKTDKYGRLLAYVFLDDGSSLNEMLLREGFAREYTVGKPYSMQKDFRDVEAMARQEKVGLWAKCETILP